MGPSTLELYLKRTELLTDARSSVFYDIITKDDKLKIIIWWIRFLYNKRYPMGIKTAKGKKIIPKIFICCLVILCLLLPCGSSNGRDRQLVRVAYFNIGDYYTEDSSGAVNSYDSEFLRAVEDYANVKFEFVDCGTWNNALNLLGEGRVDLIGTAQWTPERAKLYAYCRESYGYTVGELATLESNNIVYQIGRAHV